MDSPTVPILTPTEVSKAQFAALGCVAEAKDFSQFQECYKEAIGTLLNQAVTRKILKRKN